MFWNRSSLVSDPSLPLSDMAVTVPDRLEPEQEAKVRAVVIEACVDMFTTCGFVVRLLDLGAPLASRTNNIAGFIGFGGEIRGSLMLAGAKQLFNSTSPVAPEGGRLPDSALYDWAGEMANQLLGRIKRSFCSLGRDFHASTPTAIGGRELDRRFPLRAGVIDLVMGVGGDVLSVSFEITPPPSGKIFPEGAAPLAVSTEGDLVLF
jgi:chemotaxis protein CheX